MAYIEHHRKPPDIDAPHRMVSSGYIQHIHLLVRVDVRGHFSRYSVLYGIGGRAKRGIPILQDTDIGDLHTHYHERHQHNHLL